MQPGEGPPLAYLLLRASRWFDAGLRDLLEARGWPRLTAAQSLVFAFLDADGTPPAQLARRLGTTRQAAQDLVAGLVRLELLEVVEDPARLRGRLVRLTDPGRRLAADAAQVLADLEAALGERAAELRRLLTGPGAPGAGTPQAKAPGAGSPKTRAPAAGAPDRAPDERLADGVPGGQSPH